VRSNGIFSAVDRPHAEDGPVLGPTSRYFFSQRLGCTTSTGATRTFHHPPVHGRRDHCRSWDWVAADLRRSFHVIAPDLRGHGDSAWAIGSTYSMIDYVLDLAALLKTIDLFPITIVAHSLGARIALQYAGIYPDRVAKLVAIEGSGRPRPHEVAVGRRRMSPVGREMQALARRHPKPYRTLDEAVARMREANPHLSDEQARHLTVNGVIRHEDGRIPGSSTTSSGRSRRISSTSMRRAGDLERRSRARCSSCAGPSRGRGDPVREGHAAAFARPRS
jgi:pimeloyl-ACP methyl ester carboxylesterase